MRVIVLILALLATLRLGVPAANPPAVVAASAPPTLFAAARAMRDVRAIAMHPHPTGSVANARVSAYLAARLAAIGLRVQIRHYLIDEEGRATLARWSGGRDRTGELTDVIAVLPGRDRAAPAVVVMAHYDTVWGSPGAGDDSAGVATALEIARAVKARGVPARDLILLLTDGEEIGLSGARAFWSGDTLVRHAGVVVNLEARGLGGRATMFETGANNGAMMALFGASVRRPVANSISVFAYRHMPNDTDFTPPRERGLPGFNFAFTGRAAYYHSPQATIDRLDPRSVQDLGDQALDTVAALAFARALPAPAADVGFFDWMGRGLVRLDAGMGWLIVIGGFAALGVAGLGLARRRATSPAAVAAGVGAMLWLIVHTLLGLSLFDLLAGSAHAHYYDRLAKLPMLETQSGLVCLAAAAGFLLLGAPHRRWAAVLPAILLALLGLWLGAPRAMTIWPALAGMLIGLLLPRGGVPLWGGWIGAILVLAAAGLAAQVEAPTIAWVFAWPALLLALAAALVAWLDPRFDRGVALALCGGAAVLVSAPLLPLAHLAFVGIGAQRPIVLLLAVPSIAVAFWPLARAAAWRLPLIGVALLLIVAAGIAIHVRDSPLAASVPAYAIDK
ncbi:MAG TPA: M28 family peptidase [Sphingomonas sp.]